MYAPAVTASTSTAAESAAAAAAATPATSLSDTTSATATVGTGMTVWSLASPTCLQMLAYPVLMIFLACAPEGALATGRCFTTELGVAVEGADYRRLWDRTHRDCAIECREDASCLAYEWRAAEKVCTLRARSLNGTLRPAPGALMGFCLDEDDEVRDRIRDHALIGTSVAEFLDVEGDACRERCTLFARQNEATDPRLVPTAYSFTPDDERDEEGASGRCRCISTLHGVLLQFNSFAGFLPQQRRSSPPDAPAQPSHVVLRQRRHHLAN